MKDETGNVYGRLTVVRVYGKATKGKCLKWFCTCSCGGSKVVVGAYLRKGTTRSCGCLVRESGRLFNTTHGMSNMPVYTSYNAMIKRCNNTSDSEFDNYGGRGIKVCEEWGTFEGFYSSMGDRPHGTTLDRIDVNGDYTPSNCRWATALTQGNNRRNNHLVTANGKTQTIAEWARELGVSGTAILNRLNKGLSHDDSINTPFSTNEGLTINGETKLLSEWAKLAGVNRNTITQRLKRMTPYQAVFSPVFDKGHTMVEFEGGNVTVKHLANLVGVSSTTIKRDIAKGLSGDDIYKSRGNRIASSLLT